MVASSSTQSNHASQGQAEQTGPVGTKSAPTTGGVLIIGGPDGAGKSTLAAEVIAEVLAEVPVMHIRFPRLLPRRNRERARARRLGTGGAGGTPDLFGPRVYPRPYPWGASVWKALYLFLDFMLGWRMRVGPFVRSGGWVVFERGWWDHAVDPRRYRLRSGRPFVVLGRLIPRADLILILEADPATIHARKPQLTTEELARQMAVWHRILPRSQRRLFLDAALPVPHLIKQVETHVLDLNARRPE